MTPLDLKPPVDLKDQLYKLFKALLGRLLSSWIYQWCWNLTVVPLFHGPHIGYWQTFMLLMLIRLTQGVKS